MIKISGLSGALSHGIRSVSKFPVAWISHLDSKRKALLFRGPDGWYWLISEQARSALGAYRWVQEYMATPSERSATHLIQIRNNAQAYERMFVDRLDGMRDRSRSPARDRQDWIGLSRRLGEMVRLAQDIVKRMALFEVPPDEMFRESARLHRLGCWELFQALRDLNSRPRGSTDHLVRAQKAFAQVVYRKNWVRARAPEISNQVDAIKIRDIDGHFSEAADCGTQAAELLGDLLIKSL